MLLSKLIALPLFLVLAGAGGWLGVRLDGNDPMKIAAVVPGSPAAKAGLRKGDQIVALNGRRVDGEDALYGAFDRLGVGDAVAVTVRRGQERLTLKARLIAPPKPFLGAELEEADTGLKVIRTLQGTAAALSGLRANDLLTGVEGSRITTLDQLDKAMAGKNAGDLVSLSVRRGGRNRKLSCLLGARPGLVKEAPRERLQPRRTRRPARQDARGNRNARRQPARAGRAMTATNLEQAMQIARRARRPILAVFGASWSEGTQSLKKAMANRAVQAALASFVVVMVDTDKEGRMADRYDVQSLPDLQVLGANGKRKARKTGYVAPRALAQWLRRNAPRGGDRRQAEPRQRGNLQNQVRQLQRQMREMRSKMAQQQKMIEELRRRIDR